MGSGSSSARKSQRKVIPASSQNEPLLTFIDKSLCRKHGGKILSKYSEQNGKLYCELCLSGNRNDVSEVTDIVDYVHSIQFRQRKIKTDNEVRSRKRNFQALLADVKDNKVALDTQKNNLIEEINNFKSAVIDIIKYLCEGLCEKVMQIYDKEKASLDKRDQSLHDYLEKLTPKEPDVQMMKNPDVLKLLNSIEMEKSLSNLPSEKFDNTFVDIQLKLHDNIPIRKLLSCDKTASTLGEVIVLRNAKTERPCTKDLIIHDITDADESDGTDDTLTETDNKDIADKPRLDKYSEKRASSLSRTMNIHDASIINRKVGTERQYHSFQDMDNWGIISANSGKHSKTDFNAKGPIRSVAPRVESKSRLQRDAKVQSATSVERRSASRISQSVKSNFSIMTPSSIQFGTPVNERKFFERNAILVQSISLPGDNKPNDIVSSVILPNKNVILCDRSNRKLKYFDHTFHHVNDLSFDYEPNSICLLNDTVMSKDDQSMEVAITFPRQKVIQVVSVTEVSLVKVDEIRTEPECWGIGCRGKSLVFSTEKGDIFREVSDYRNYRWRKYQYTFQKPVSLIVDKDLIFVCNWGLEEVPGSLVAMYFDDKGKNQIKFSYSNRSLRHPVSCSIDCEGNIYVCDEESPRIHQLSPDGSQFRLFDANGGQAGSWQHINFVPESDYFISAQTGSNVLYVFQMK